MEKDNDVIKADGKKYFLDIADKYNPKLSIICLEFADSGKYSIFVENALGTTQDQIDINVKATTMIFITGPVVVLPSGKIQFQTIYPPDINSTHGKWFRTKSNNVSKLQFGAKGYAINTSSSQPKIQTIEIIAKENEGAYQLSVNHMKSNIIKVLVNDSGNLPSEAEGNCLRFYLLQKVSTNAMRALLDKKSVTFAVIWNGFQKFCTQKKGKFLEVLPKSPPSSSSDLDITIIYSMFRNSIDIQKPSKGWGRTPDENDRSIGDDIERVRIYRNKICHENSFEMTTAEFNKSALDLIGAIRRLTDDEMQLINEICDILNTSFRKGEELEEMIEKFKEFKQTETEREDILKETEVESCQSIEDVQLIDADEMTNENDEKAIYFTGRKELFIGEMATIIAFIDPRISALSKIFWQRTDERGYIHIIDTNDGKYTGSTTTFPSPTLYIHFVRKDDEGTYRLCVDTFNKVVHNSVSLLVKEGECDGTGNVDASEEIGIHSVRDSNISLLHNNTIARKINGMDTNGVCFTNRPINVGEKIYLRIAETHAYWSSSMDFGLTNEDPNNISVPPTKSIYDVRKNIVDVGFDILPDFNDVLCFTLNTNNTLSFSINDIEQPARNLGYVSVNNPVWLSFDLYGRTRAVEISSKKKKKTPCNSYFREYLF